MPPNKCTNLCRYAASEDHAILLPGKIPGYKRTDLQSSLEGTRYVPIYIWAAFLSPHFRKILQLKQYYHITISCGAPGTLSLKLAANGETEQLHLLRDGWEPTADELPPVVPPPHLTPERQWYLYTTSESIVQRQLRIPSLQTHCCHKVGGLSEDSSNTTEGR